MKTKYLGRMAWAIIGSVAGALIGLLISAELEAHVMCPHYTPEQRYLLGSAYHIAEPQAGLGYEFAALVAGESLNCRPGKPICRSNPSDGDLGSYGVTQIQLSTIILVEGVEDTKENRDYYRHKLQTDDMFALNWGFGYLHSHRERGVKGMFTRYNGAGPDARAYSKRVLARAVTLEHCFEVPDGFFVEKP